MRKLKLQMQLTIDGFVGTPTGEMDWMEWNWDEELKQFVAELTQPVDCIVLGRQLAEGFIPYWATVAADANDAQHEAGIKFTDTPKVVFTRTLDQSKWPNTQLAKGELAAEIASLKSQPGADIIAYGGATFVSALIKANLIDDYYLFINPSAIGKGLSIFSQYEGTLKLKLINAKQFDCGIVVMHYQRN